MGSAQEVVKWKCLTEELLDGRVKFNRDAVLEFTQDGSLIELLLDVVQQWVPTCIEGAMVGGKVRICVYWLGGRRATYQYDGSQFVLVRED